MLSCRFCLLPPGGEDGDDDNDNEGDDDLVITLPGFATISCQWSSSALIRTRHNELSDHHDKGEDDYHDDGEDDYHDDGEVR